MVLVSNWEQPGEREPLSLATALRSCPGFRGGPYTSAHAYSTNGLNGFKKNYMKLGEKKCGGDLGLQGREQGCIWPNTLHSCMKFSNKWEKQWKHRTTNSCMKDLGGRLACHLGIRIKLRTTIFEIQLFFLLYVIPPGTFPRIYILN